MQDPIPPTGWKPTASTLGGAGIGAALSVVVVTILGKYLHTQIVDPNVAIAINTLCVAAAGYLFPDGGRK
jgi:hypothetical protein